MKRIFPSLIFYLLIQYIASGQNFIDSKDFQLTKIPDSVIERFHKNNEFPQGEFPIYIIDNKGVKLKALKIDLESYSNDGVILEYKDSKLKNIKNILRVVISHCACYCDTEIYFWLITDNNKWIKLPSIQQENYEIELKTKNYVFPKDRPNEIQLLECQDIYVPNGKFDIKNYKRKSEKVLKTLIWNGKELLEK